MTALEAYLKWKGLVKVCGRFQVELPMGTRTHLSEKKEKKKKKMK